MPNTALLEFLRRELRPMPDRLAGSLRDTLSMILALVLMEILRIPGAMLGLALLFLTHRESPVHLVRTATQIVCGCAVANLVSVVLVQLSDGNEVARVLFVIVWIFVAVCGQQASPWPVFFINTGFYGFLFLSAWDSHLAPGRIVLNNLSDLAALALSLLCFVFVDFVFRDRSPREELRRQMRERVGLLAAWLETLQDRSPGWRVRVIRMRTDLIRSAYGSTDRLQELEQHLENPLLSSRVFPSVLQRRIDCIRRMLASAVFLEPLQPEDARTRELATWLERLESEDLTARFRADPLTSPPNALAPDTRSGSFGYWLEQLHATFTVDARVDRCGLSPASSVPGWSWSVFFNREARLFALKTTLAALICYVTYSAIGWPGIVTCVTTVLFTALSTSGAMKEKQVYRFVGSLSGGLVAVATVSLVIPNIESITALVLVVAPVVFVSAWILRSPRIGYVGLQISYTFFTTLIAGFRASPHVTPARDRMVGIALGSFVMWVVFDQLWPVRSSDSLSTLLKRLLNVEAELSKGESHESRQWLAEIASIAAQVPAVEDAVTFDFGTRSAQERSKVRRISRRFHFAFERLLRSINQHSMDHISDGFGSELIDSKASKTSCAIASAELTGNI